MNKDFNKKLTRAIFLEKLDKQKGRVAKLLKETNE
jgi:hypothetical protein